MPGHTVLFGAQAHAAQLLFLASGALRIGAAALALRIEEPGARTVRTLGRMALRSACAEEPGPATSAA
ncbi:MAG: hypothetical protein E6J85_16610 [Deltaproteobacteria bacterium]|nr:MAG: hypothetical protein E6J85_16610 [Deltaproteobacteria bacterium]